MGSIVGITYGSQVLLNKTKAPITGVTHSEWYNAEGQYYTQAQLSVMDIPALEFAIIGMEAELAKLKQNKDDNKGEIELTKANIKYAQALVKAKKKGDKEAEKAAADQAKKERDKVYDTIDKPSVWDRLFGSEGAPSPTPTLTSPYIPVPSANPKPDEGEPKKDNTWLYVGLGAGGFLLLGMFGLVVYKLNQSPKK